MMKNSRIRAAGRQQRGRAPHRRRWWRWLLLGVVALVVLALLAVWGLARLQPQPAPLTLPTAAAQPPSGPQDGTWYVTAGSLAGFRVRETTLGVSKDAVGRTSGVTGRLVVSGDRVTSADFRIDLTTITVSGKPQPQVASSLATGRYPDATLTLSEPVMLASAFTSGATVRVQAMGLLTLRGSSHPVTFTATGRRDGAAIQIAGSLPVAFAEWGISEPAGYGILGSLANHGVAEFLLELHQH